MVEARSRSEAILERNILREFGRDTDLILLPNEVGVGFRGALLPALEAALTPFGRQVVEAAEHALNRNRTKYGLGVGSPDLVGTCARRPFGLELKSEDGELSEEQLRFHAAARRRGIPVGVARSVDEAKAFFDRVRRLAIR
jgi:hypothetical protein